MVQAEVRAIVRPATVGDAPAVAEIHVRSWQKAYRGMLSDEVLDSLSVSEWTEKRRKFLQQPAPEQRFWILEAGQLMEGFLDMGASRDAPAGDRVAEIYAIYLHPRCWGQGLGRTLMDRAIQDLRSGNWQQVELWVLEQNLQARRFYEAAGFNADGATRPDSFRGCTWTDLRYTLRLV